MQKVSWTYLSTLQTYLFGLQSEVINVFLNWIFKVWKKLLYVFVLDEVYTN